MSDKEIPQKRPEWLPDKEFYESKVALRARIKELEAVISEYVLSQLDIGNKARIAELEEESAQWKFRFEEVEEENERLRETLRAIREQVQFQSSHYALHASVMCDDALKESDE